MLASLRAPLAGAARSSWFRLALQLLVGVALIAALLSLDFGALWRLVAGADPLLLAVVLALNMGYTYLLSERWRLILRGLGARQPSLPLFDLTMRGYFFGTFLPSNAGGDVVKAYLLSRRGVWLSLGLLSVALDRVAGLVALAWLGAPAGWLATGGGSLMFQVSALGLLAVAAGLTAAAIIGPRLLALCERPALALTPSFAQPALRSLLDAVRTFASRPALFLLATVFSLPLHFIYIFMVYLLLLALHATVDPLRLTWAITWATLAGALPISFSGFGPREAAFVATLGSPGELAVAVGLLTGALQILSGLPGGVLQLLEGSSPRLAGPELAAQTPPARWLGASPAAADEMVSVEPSAD